MAPLSSSPSPPLDKERHLRYFKRCFSTYLPHQYTSNDSIRMTLGFFVIAAIDLLSANSNPDPASSSCSNPPKPATKPIITPSDRPRLRQWILRMQHPAGGFCGSPTHALPRHLYEDDTEDVATENASTRDHQSSANIAATYFALLLLPMLAEGDGSAAYAGVDRAATLGWLRRLQRDDGSFGEVLRDDGGIAGGYDMRYCYFAAMIRWVLRGDVGEGRRGWVEDYDVRRLVGYIRRGQTYDGGVAESSQHEAHAGYAFCAVSALSLLDRPLENSTAQNRGANMQNGIGDPTALVKFLVSRQFAYLGDEEEETGKEDDTAPTQPPPLSDLSLDAPPTPSHVGFNGRCNKAADTCYCWWVGGALALLGRVDLIAAEPARRFLLDKTQHPIGGFAKHPGGPPDVYHAYLGLAALATMGEPALKPFDASLCVTVDTVRKVEAARRALLSRAAGAGHGSEDGFVLGRLRTFADGVRAGHG